MDLGVSSSIFFMELELGDRLGVFESSGSTMSGFEVRGGKSDYDDSLVK